MLIRFYSIAVCLVLAISAFAQRVDTDIRIFNKNIHSLKIAPVDKPYGLPIIALGSDEQLNVNFDLIDYDAHSRKTRPPLKVWKTWLALR